METIIIDAEWEELPLQNNDPKTPVRMSNWLDKLILIEYSYFGLAFCVKLVSTLFISACE